MWAAMRAVFHMPEKSPLCGSHIHISRGPGRSFTLSQLKTIAYGIVLYEPLVLKFLVDSRVGNDYCRPNSQNSSRLRGVPAGSRAQLIAAAGAAEALKTIMQDDRRVLWNFANIVPGKTGTIEFRGGRGLRGGVRTKWWIAFTVSFIHAVLTMVRPATLDT